MDNVAAKIAGLLGISGAKSVLIDTASSSGASAFENAYLEVASGRYDRVLAIGIQKMTAVPTAEATQIIAGVIDTEEAEYGLTMPACGALVAKSLMRKYQLDEAEWTHLAAQWAERYLRSHDVEEAVAVRVAELILATKTHDAPQEADQQLLVDIDLSILGRPPEEFEVYDQAIRREYAWVPESEYRTGRHAVLSRFFERQSIYGTETFRALYEKQARDNLARKLKELRA
jgi:hypothetical protein